LHAEGDRTVPFGNMDYIFEHISSKDRRKYVFKLDGWQHRKHLLTMYNATYGKVYENIVNFIVK
jgi:hypothetical protein